MILEDGIVALLANAGEVARLVGGPTVTKARVYPLVLPQNPTFPALTHQRVSGVRELTHDGPDGVVWCRLQIDTWASSFVSATQLADAVRRVLDGFRGLAGEVTVQRAELLADRHLHEADLNLYRVSQDFGIWYEESTAR